MLSMGLIYCLHVRTLFTLVFDVYNDQSSSQKQIYLMSSRLLLFFYIIYIHT